MPPFSPLLLKRIYILEEAIAEGENWLDLRGTASLTGCLARHARLCRVTSHSPASLWRAKRIPRVSVGVVHRLAR